MNTDRAERVIEIINVVRDLHRDLDLGLIPHHMVPLQPPTDAQLEQNRLQRERVNAAFYARKAKMEARRLAKIAKREATS